jgi:hypothetical protein
MSFCKDLCFRLCESECGTEKNAERDDLAQEGLQNVRVNAG